MVFGVDRVRERKTDEACVDCYRVLYCIVLIFYRYYSGESARGHARQMKCAELHTHTHSLEN